MPNAHDRIVDRILHHLEHVGRSPVDRYTLLRVTATLDDAPGAVARALDHLILRGDVRRVGMLYQRVPARWPRREEARSA